MSSLNYLKQFFIHLLEFSWLFYALPSNCIVLYSQNIIYRIHSLVLTKTSSENNIYSLFSVAIRIYKSTKSCLLVMFFKFLNPYWFSLLDLSVSYRKALDSTTPSVKLCIYLYNSALFCFIYSEPVLFDAYRHRIIDYSLLNYFYLWVIKLSFS